MMIRSHLVLRGSFYRSIYRLIWNPDISRSYSIKSNVPSSFVKMINWVCVSRFFITFIFCEWVSPANYLIYRSSSCSSDRLIAIASSYVTACTTYLSGAFRVLDDTFLPDLLNFSFFIAERNS